jgi:hypothetical protein
MNERIRQLADEARKYAWKNETHWSANAEREALFEQKFAELIVRECISTLDQDDGATHHGELLQEHFGVDSA